MSDNRILSHLDEAVHFIRERSKRRPTLALVLGSGLGPFAETLMDRTEISYADIPNFPQSTVAGHAGKLVIGRFEQTELMVMAGRVHAYEGYEEKDVIFPTRVLGRLGVTTLLLTNAAGAINTAFKPGELMIVTDHLNLTGKNPLVGPNVSDLGVRFPDMSNTYHVKLRELMEQGARRIGLPLRHGVYAAVMGPSFETPAEIRMLRAMGADAVGMSTAWEAIAANHMGMRVAALSCLSNMGAGITKHALNHQEVMEVGDRVRGIIIELFGEILPAFAKMS